MGSFLSVVDNKTVDGVALTDDKKGIILLMPLFTVIILLIHKK